MAVKVKYLINFRLFMNSKPNKRDRERGKQIKIWWIFIRPGYKFIDDTKERFTNMTQYNVR